MLVPAPSQLSFEMTLQRGKQPPQRPHHRCLRI